jgi:hypothetical protein
MAPKRAARISVLLVCALFVAHAAIALGFAFYGRVNHDEGWYLLAARQLREGALPYRDFAFFQAPLLPFVYALAQPLLGEGLAAGRIVSFAFGAAAIALAARLAHRLGGRPAALLLLATAPLAPRALWCLTTTRTEPLVAFLWTLCALLLLRPSRSAAASAGALAAAVLAAGTRISSLPALALVALWVLLRHRGARSELRVALLPGAALAAALCAVALAAGPEAVFFDVVTAQADRHAQLAPAEAFGAGRFLLRRLRDLAMLQASFGIVPVLGFACAIGAAVLARRAPANDPTRAFAASVARLALLAFAVYLPNLAPRVVWPEYFAGVYPLFLVIAAGSAGRGCALAAPAQRRAFAAAIAVLWLFQAALFAREIEGHVSIASPDLRELQSFSAELARLVPAGRTLLTLDAYLAVESGLAVPEGFEMGLFAYFPNRSAEDGRRLKILTDARLAEALASPSVGLAAISDRALGVLVNKQYGAYRPYAQLTQEEIHAALPGLARYRLERVVPEFGQFRENLYVLRPDDAP